MSVPSSFEAPSPAALAALMPAYDFEVLIASGGMGAVYKGRQRSLERDVAIKILPPELMADPAFRKSFETEARAMARLNHPNLISIYDFGDLDGMAYIVMEFVPGKSLYHSAYGKQIHPVQAVELAIGICHGLAHAHDNGILHRDIKPANILLNKKAEPKIGDFGLAHPMESEGPGLVMGTPGYTAPEVMRQPETADRRSDLYAVGVILYELLSGQRQHAGSPPPSVVCEVDVALDRIWQRATNTNPGLRYPDCHAFAADLSEWLKRRNASKETPAGDGANPRPGPPIRMPAQRLEEEEPVKTKSGFGGMLVNLLLLGGIAAGAYYGWQYFQSQRPTTPPTEIPKEDATTKPRTPRIPIPGVLPGGGGSKSSDESPFGRPIPGPSGGDTPSPGGTTGSTSPSNTPAPDPLTPKARELISVAEADRTKALAENVKRLTDELDLWTRGLAKAEAGKWQPDVDKLKGTIRNSRVPTTIPEGGPIRLSAQMSKSASYAAGKQKQIDADYLTKVTRYRDLYVGRMRTAIEDGGKNGQSIDALSLRLAEAADVTQWVAGLGGTVQPANPVVEEKSGNNEYPRDFRHPGIAVRHSGQTVTEITRRLLPTGCA